MQVKINGRERDIETPCNLMELLQQLEVNPQLVAVEYNGEILRRESFESVVLQEGDVLEIVHMVGGGA
ncbi:MAG: sulfur carrier protein ThiS [Chloroflexi bacterium]|nr:sulfur carrier protein ThiS [Chloroflexota bacterium]